MKGDDGAKIALLARGVPPQYADLLAFGRDLTAVEALSIDQIGAILCVKPDVATNCHAIIQAECTTNMILRFDEILFRLVQALWEIVDDYTSDSRAVNLTKLFSKYSNGEEHGSFEHLHRDYDAVLKHAIELVALDSGISDTVLGSFDLVVHLQTLEIVDLRLPGKEIGQLAKLMEHSGYLNESDAEFVNLNADLLSDGRPPKPKQGQLVRSVGAYRPKKTMRYRPSGCGNKNPDNPKEYPWPKQHLNETGTIVDDYFYGNLFLVQFDDHSRHTIHVQNLQVLITNVPRSRRSDW